MALLRRLITRRSEREATGRFVVDGPHLVAEGLLAGLVDEVFAPLIRGVIAKAEALLKQLRPSITQFHSSEYINALANGDI